VAHFTSIRQSKTTPNSTEYLKPLN